MKLQDISIDLVSNDYFKAGSGLFGLGILAAALRRGTQVLQTIVKRNFTMTMEIPSHDKSYDWVSPWLIKQTHTTHISVETAFSRSAAGKIETEYEYIPSPGTHYIRYESRFIKVERTRTQPTMTSGGGGSPFESLTLTTVGQDRGFFQRVLERARKEALLAEEGWTLVYKAVGAEWRQFGYPRTRRPLRSVVLEAGLAERVLADVSDFLDSQSWYRERGVPYRRGYLLHGPPGCGKSSFIAALAGELEYSVCSLSLAEMGMSGDRLDHLLSHAPLQSLILLEDVDAAFSVARQHFADNPVYQGMTGLTLSGLLNALDGVASTEGRILFMTTNHPDRLDPALVRPGRVDFRAELGLCSEDQLQRMFMRFYPQHPDNSTSLLAAQFARVLGPGLVTPAAAQGFLLCYKTDPGLAAASANQLRQHCADGQSAEAAL